MFCSKCGSQISEKQAFCGNCGTPVAEKRTDENVSAQIQMSNKKMVMHCPRCGNTGLQAQVSNRITSSTSIASSIGKNYAIGGTMYDSETETFWCCSNCGMKFRDLDELQNIIFQQKKSVNACKKFIVVSAIVYFIVGLLIAFVLHTRFVFLPIAIFYFAFPFIPIAINWMWSARDAKNKEIEYNNLLPKVRRIERK